MLKSLTGGADSQTLPAVHDQIHLNFVHSESMEIA